MMENDKKPVSFVQGRRAFYRENGYAQNLLIKALSQGITDPKELRDAAGLRTVAEVYRSLDKIAIRKEYHNALMDNGVDLNFIVRGFKDLAGSDSDAIRLGAFNALLKSLGLDKYEKMEDGGRSWEEEVNRISEAEVKMRGDVIEGQIVPEEKGKVKYEVIAPPTPKEERDRQNRERALGKDLYAD